MAEGFVGRHDDRIAGVLACCDRIIIVGTLSGICYAKGMTAFLRGNGIRIFNYPQFAAGVSIEHVAKSHIRKESVVAKVIARRGNHPGLVHVISAAANACTTILFHRCRAWADLRPGSDLDAVPSTDLLQWPQLAGE